MALSLNGAQLDLRKRRDELREGGLVGVGDEGRGRADLVRLLRRGLAVAEVLPEPPFIGVDAS